MIGGYTTAILISDQGLKLGSHTFSSDMTDIWTIPIAGLVAGLAGFLFGFPALRLTGLYLALATFAIAVAAPAVVRKFDEFTGGGGGINMFGLPGLTGVIDPVKIPLVDKPLSFNEWLYYLSWTIALVMLAAAWLMLRGRFGRSLRAVRDSELAAASSGVTSPATRRSPSGSVRSTQAWRGAPGDRDDVRQRTPSRSHCPSSCSSASWWAALALSGRSSSGDLHPLHADRVGTAGGSGDPDWCRCSATSTTDAPVLPRLPSVSS